MNGPATTATTANILEHLYNKAVSNLDQDTLEWLADGGPHAARLMVENLSAVTGNRLSGRL